MGQKYISANDTYKILYPPIVFESDLSQVFSNIQITSTLNKLSNLVGLEVRSSALSSNAERIVSNSNTLVSSNVVADFIINSDEQIGTNLIYTLDAIPYRQGTLSNLTEIRSMDFTVFAKYSDDSTIQTYLRPGENMNLRLSFFRYG